MYPGKGAERGGGEVRYTKGDRVALSFVYAFIVMAWTFLACGLVVIVREVGFWAGFVIAVFILLACLFYRFGPWKN